MLARFAEKDDAAPEAYLRLMELGEAAQDWPAVAAGSTLFLLPILVFTVLLRKHLLRGITFGALRK